MSEVLTFSQCLNQIMQKHRLSVVNLATLIGRRADLKHVLADDATHSKRSTLYQKLLESNLFDEADYLRLEKALEVSRLGVECYRFQQAVDHVLKGEPLQTRHVIATENNQPLSKALAFLNEAEKIEIICFNCCHPSLSAALMPLFQDTARDIHMRHYLQAQGDWSTAAEYVAIFLPLIFDTRYEPYIRNPLSEMQLPSIGGNILLIRSIIRNEIIERCYVIANNQNAFELTNAESSHFFSFVSKVLRNVAPEPLAVKEAYPHELDFPSLCMTFLSHELNRATYSISKDLCFQQIPTDIAVAAFLDKGIDCNEELQRVVQRTLSIHEQRYQNQYRKKKHTYRIMTIEGCERFLDTGKTTDHFIGFRAFAPEERKEIFDNMLIAARENPFFIPLLLKEGHFSHRYNLVCYDKLGVSLDVKDTNYDIDSGYRSVFLMYPAFTKQYQKYYLDILVGEKCYSRQESLSLLEDMYKRFLIRFDLA